MWRFLLAGSFTVAGLVLLLLAATNDPAAQLQRLDEWLAGPAATNTNTSEPTNPFQAPQQQSASAAGPQSASTAKPPEMDAVLQQQAQVQQRLQTLESQYAQATHDLTALRTEADDGKRQLAASQQQHAADQAQLKQQSDAAKQEIDALRRQHDDDQAALKKAQDAAAHPSPAQPGDKAASKPPASATGQAAAPAAKPPAPATGQAAATTPAAKPPAPPAGQAAATTPAAKSPPAPDYADAVINRLRHTAPQPPVSRNSEPPTGDAQASSAHNRLASARAALAAGRIDDARRLLEQAQVQLVFRPVDAAGNVESNGSVAAGDVAEALSMLGAGDVRDAMQYIELALRQSHISQAPASQPVIAARSPYDNGWMNNGPSQ